MPTDAPPAVPSRVWLADDRSLEAEHTLGLLSRAGYQLEAYADGARLLERLAQPDVAPPDLLLLDWHIPGVSGLEVCRFLRERFLPTELPILVLTGRQEEGALEEAFGAGANDYVVKPARPVELLARVRTLLQARRDAEALRVRERERERLLSEVQAARAETEAERRRLATILATLQEGVLLQDARGAVRFSNAATERLMGLSAEEMEGLLPTDPRWEAVRPDGSLASAEELSSLRALRTGQSVTGAVLGVRHADGRRVWLSINVQPLFDQDGVTPTSVVTSFVDVTAQHTAAAERERLLGEVEAARVRLASLIEHAPAFVCTLRGPEHVYELVNPPYQRLVGMGRPMVGLPLREALPEAVEQGFVGLLDGVYRTGEPYIGREVPARVDRSGDGALTEAYLNFVYQPMRDASGVVAGIDVFGFEVTEQVLARRQVEALAEERRQFLEILNHGDACAVLDAHANFVFVNANYEKLTRRTREELLGENHWELFPAARGTAYEAHLHRAMKERVSVEFEEHYAPLGIWTAVTAYPTRTGGVAFFVRDASARRLAEAQVAQLAAVVEESPDFIGICQLDGPGVFVNRAGQRLLGLKGAEDVSGAHISDFFVPEDLPAVAAAQEQALRVGSSSGELRLRHFETGEAIPILWNIVTIKDPRSGEPLALATLSRDLREQKQREAEAQRREDFEQQLIGIVSHDLRNPLSAILMAAATLLRRPDLEERQRRLIGRILTSAERAIRMIRDLLDFTQARFGGTLPVSRAPVDLHALARQVVDEVQVAEPERTIAVAHEGDGHGTWDADRLAQVLGNLLSNALHYSPADTPVRVLTRGEADAVVLEVRNRGTPIAAELLARLFQPMQRGREQGASSGRSVGLGLYIVDQVVRAHGGSVEVSSTAEAGTAFTVRLPRREARAR